MKQVERRLCTANPPARSLPWRPRPGSPPRSKSFRSTSRHSSSTTAVRRRLRIMLRQINELIAANRRGDAVAFFMTEVVGTPAEAVAQMKSAPTWPALEAVAHTLPYDIAVLGDNMAGNPLPTDRWTAATAPTLVMDGGASPAWIRNSARTFAGILPNAQHRTLEGQTHAAAPEVLAPEIERFFSVEAVREAGVNPRSAPEHSASFHGRSWRSAFRRIAVRAAPQSGWAGRRHP